MSSGFRNAPAPVKEFLYDKTKVKIYGGWGTIGGNCIVIEDPSLKVMLDQGVNFSQLKINLFPNQQASGKKAIMKHNSALASKCVFTVVKKKSNVRGFLRLYEQLILPHPSTRIMF